MLIGGLRPNVVSELGLQADILEASTAAELLIEDFAELVTYTSAHAPTEAVLCFAGQPSHRPANLLFVGFGRSRPPWCARVRVSVCVCAWCWWDECTFLGLRGWSPVHGPSVHDSPMSRWAADWLSH